MSYIDGYVIPVPIAKKQEYIEMAKTASAVFFDYGALEIYENWGDDIPDGKVTSFPLSVQCKEDEAVVFSWVVWPSKEVREEGWKSVMADPRMQPGSDPMPFDGKRLIYGGFENIICKKK